MKAHCNTLVPLVAFDLNRCEASHTWSGASYLFFCDGDRWAFIPSREAVDHASTLSGSGTGRNRIEILVDISDLQHEETC